MVAIKDMEMPFGCEVCDFRKSDPYSGEVYCSKAIGSNTIIYEKERLENCPLVEIITCQDCKHCHPDEDGRGYHCERDNYVRFSVYGDFYCAYAERIE